MSRDKWTVSYINEFGVHENVDVETMDELMRRVCIIHAGNQQIISVTMTSGTEHRFEVNINHPNGTWQQLFLWAKNKEALEKMSKSILPEGARFTIRRKY